MTGKPETGQQVLLSRNVLFSANYPNYIQNLHTTFSCEIKAESILASQQDQSKCGFLFG